MSKPVFPSWPRELLDALTAAGYQPVMQHGRIVMRHWQLNRFVTRKYHPYFGPGGWVMVEQSGNHRFRRLSFRDVTEALAYFGAGQPTKEPTS